MGAPWGKSSDRGVYRTDDGGKTWKKVLYINDTTGPGDLVVNPSNPNHIIAGMWQHLRRPYDFYSGGEGSGMHVSYDRGDTWKKLGTEEGMPKGELGRIGLAFAPSKPNIVYALIEAKENGLYKSTDGGDKWSLVSKKDIGNRPFYYSDLWVDPMNENRIYNLWSYVSRSQDGGKTFKTIMDYGNNVHPDHHAFWIDPDDSNYLINGNDGGLNISRDGGESWMFAANIPVGQFYHVDLTTNDTTKQHQDKSGGLTIDATNAENYTTIITIVPSPIDDKVVWAGTDDGNIQVTRDGGNTWTNTIKNIRSAPKNSWINQIEVSSKNAGEAFVALNNYRQNDYEAHAYHTTDYGKTWKRIADGRQIKSFVQCIVQDPVEPNLLFIGADSGLYVSFNKGQSWTE